jgi:gas vesicle protein
MDSLNDVKDVLAGATVGAALGSAIATLWLRLHAAITD